MKPIATIAVLAVAGTLFAEKMPFERYQSIIDRQPFGQPPPGFNPQQMASDVSRTAADEGAVPLSVEQEQLQKSVGFSVINVESDGSVMVGFSDKSDPKSPKHYYMRVGEERDGWLVKDGDPVKKSMTVVKDSVEITLDLGSNSAADTKQGGKPAAAQPAGGRSPLLMRGGAAGGMSFHGRKARREAEEAQAKAAAAASEAARKREAEEAAAKEAEEKAAREAERAEQRQQLLAIQEELRKAREEKARKQEAEEAQQEGGNAEY
jgi:hypothetical protein